MTETTQPRSLGATLREMLPELQDKHWEECECDLAGGDSECKSVSTRRFLAITEALRRLEWQPMETVPNEGQFVVCWTRGGMDMMGGIREYNEILGYGEPPALGWIPLPPPVETRR